MQIIFYSICTTNVKDGGSDDTVWSRELALQVQYWYHGCFRTHLSRMPASVLILMEAASAAVTVSFTDCIKFCALPTNMSVASRSSSVPVSVSGIKSLAQHTFRCEGRAH